MYIYEGCILTLTIRVIYLLIVNALYTFLTYSHRLRYTYQEPKGYKLPFLVAALTSYHSWLRIPFFLIPNNTVKGNPIPNSVPTRVPDIQRMLNVSNGSAVRIAMAEFCHIRSYIYTTQSTFTQWVHTWPPIPRTPGGARVVGRPPMRSLDKLFWLAADSKT